MKISCRQILHILVLRMLGALTLVIAEQSSVKPDSIDEIDLTFPGCGLRLPKIQENAESSIENSWKMNVQHIIAGGNDATANSWPWMVALFLNLYGSKTFICGASLISKRYVMSAAHCVEFGKGKIFSDPSIFVAVVGSHTTKDGTEYPVEGIIVHPDYKIGQSYNDIALLRIKNEVTLTEKVYPVCLPSGGLRDKMAPDNNNVTVTGWGRTSFDGENSKILQELDIPIVPLTECNAYYSKLTKFSQDFPKGITKEFICAGVKEGGKDACPNDSGGPLVSKLKDNSYVQVGTVSTGYKCALPEYPGIYMRVSHYEKWIYDNTDLGKK